MKRAMRAVAWLCGRWPLETLAAAAAVGRRSAVAEASDEGGGLVMRAVALGDVGCSGSSFESFSGG
jgi:hypothetical protein